MPTRNEIIIIIIMVFLLIIIINLENNRIKKYKEVGFNMEIKETKIKGSENFGVLHGAIFFKKNMFVNGSATLIGNNPIDKKYWSGHGPDVDFNNVPHQCLLYDLDFPYTLSKLSNSDTINVIKDNISFKFKMD